MIGSTSGSHQGSLSGHFYNNYEGNKWVNPWVIFEVWHVLVVLNILVLFGRAVFMGGRTQFHIC